MGNEVDVQQTGAPWTKKIGWNPCGGVGEDSTELGKRHGLGRDRPVQVGSHFHFFEVNRALVFDRQAAYGMRLDLPAGTAVRFEPGDIKTVQLVALGGSREVYGGSALVMGALDDPGVRQRSLERMRQAKFGNTGN